MQDEQDVTNLPIEQLSNFVQHLYQKVKDREIVLEEIALLKIIEKFFSEMVLLPQESVNLEIAANFLMVISELIFWKSNLLLPSYQDQSNEDTESDTVFSKAEYWKEYKKYQPLVRILAEKEIKQQDIYLTCFGSLTDYDEPCQQNNHYTDLILAMEAILSRKNKHNIINFEKNEDNIINKMEEIEKKFSKSENKLSFSQIVSESYSKIEIIIIFLALLELICQGKVDYVQTKNFDEIIFYRKEDQKLKKKNTQL